VEGSAGGFSAANIYSLKESYVRSAIQFATIYTQTYICKYMSLSGPDVIAFPNSLGCLFVGAGVAKILWDSI